MLQYRLFIGIYYKSLEIKGFIGGNRRNETRYRYSLPDFMYVRISR